MGCGSHRSPSFPGRDPTRSGLTTISRQGFYGWMNGPSSITDLKDHLDTLVGPQISPIGTNVGHSATGTIWTGTAYGAGAENAFRKRLIGPLFLEWFRA
jgi:hypothetical protein